MMSKAAVAPTTESEKHENRNLALDRLVAVKLARHQGRPPVYPAPEFVSLAEYADVIRVNRSALWKKVYAGLLPGAGYVGRRIRIHWRSALGLPAKPGHLEDDGPLILNVAQVAERLRVKGNTVYEMIKRGCFPGVLPSGKPYRILWPDVIQWFRNGQGRVSRSKRR